jgi:DNA-binding transcriptional ArsR family regulator
MPQSFPGKRSHKETNQIRVFLALRESSPLTKNDLCRHLNLSRPTVDVAIRRLMTSNLVVRSGQGPSQGGRRAILYAFNGQANYAIGGDLEIPELNLALCGLDGTPGLEKESLVPTDLLPDPRKTLAFVTRSIRTLAEEAGISLGRVVGLGLGAPARLDGDTITFPGDTLPRWKGIPARAMLEQSLGIPVFIDNDVNYMALAENHATDDSVPVMSYIALRKGLRHELRLGASALVEGRIFRGGNGNAVWLEHAYAPLPATDSPADKPIHLSAKALLEIVGEFISPILQMIRMFDPNKLVINAVVLGRAEAPFVKQIKTGLKAKLGRECANSITVVPAQDRQCSGAKGGALAVLHDLFSRPNGLIEGLATPST